MGLPAKCCKRANLPESFLTQRIDQKRTRKVLFSRIRTPLELSARSDYPCVRFRKRMHYRLLIKPLIPDRFQEGLNARADLPNLRGLFQFHQQVRDAGII